MHHISVFGRSAGTQNLLKRALSQETEDLFQCSYNVWRIETHISSPHENQSQSLVFAVLQEVTFHS